MGRNELRFSVSEEDFPEYGVRCVRPRVENTGETPARVYDAEFPVLSAGAENGGVLGFRSEWGREFTPWWHAPGQELRFGSASGRSSHGFSPCLFLFDTSGGCRFAAVCWPGNWELKVSKEGEVRFVFPCGGAELGPHAELSLPAVLTGEDARGLEALSFRARRFMRERWLPPSRAVSPLVEWNHWWAYEDDGIDEAVFCANADEAAKLGVELCTLDAGWFGDAASPAHWTQCRGDWDIVNRRRFPHGLRYLADYVHARGMKFGLWMEPEGMGERSRLRKRHPEWEALRGGAPLPEPMLCLGAAGAEDWLFGALDAAVSESGCDWLKLDFNVDPGAGCDRRDHGHEPELGLLRHLQAYIRVLDRLRAAHPALVVEICSSGGLRLDAELLRHADVAFLSDPDEPAHSLQCLWGATLLFPPERLLHFAWSQTRPSPDGGRVFPELSIGENTPEWAVRAALRCAMLHRMGLSRDLTALTPRAREIFREEIARYRERIFPLLQTGGFYRLCRQPLRRGARADDGRLPAPPGSGLEPQEGAAAFLLWNGREGALFLFRLDAGAPEPVRLRGLCPERFYRLTDADTGRARTARGAALLREGFLPEPLPPGASELIFLQEESAPSNR